MILTRKSTAWVLVGLQTALAVFFTHFLSRSAGGDVPLFGGPSWFTTLALLSFGVALLLFFFALWRFELTAIALLFAVHTICPSIFFTDLTRNPYFTQIFLLNVWIGFLWIARLWEGISAGRLSLPRTPLDLPLFAFFLVASASLLASFATHDSSFYPSMMSEGLKRWLFLGINCLAVFYIAVTIEEKWRRRFLWTTFWVGFLAAGYGVMQYYGMEKIWSKSISPFQNRPVSTFGNPNFLSSYLLLLVPLLAVEFLALRSAFSRLLAGAMLLMTLAGIAATMTRSTWVGTLFAFAVLALHPAVRELARRNRRLLTILAAAIVLCAVFWPQSRLGGYSSLWQRIVEIRNVDQSSGYGPWHQRILIWSCCFQMLREHLIFGKGWGLLELFYPYYQGPMLFSPVLRSWRTHANNAHNEVLEIWSQTGTLGMGVYVWIWVIVIAFALRSMKHLSESQPDRAPLTWALLAGAGAMFVDNFFGNVSLHFAVPGFLFWWQLGLLFGQPRAESSAGRNPHEWRTIDVGPGAQAALGLAMAGFLAVGIFFFRREFQEIHYFRGFKLSKAAGSLEPARVDLETAWKWYDREVNSNYELANTYARLSQMAAQAGLAPQADGMRKKSIWGYVESLNSNRGYDEIFFNLAAVQSQVNWMENDFPGFSVQRPDGSTVEFTAQNLDGAIVNYSRALRINPLSLDAYTFLGNVYLQNPDKYAEAAVELYGQAARMFPKNKEFHVNQAFLQIKLGRKQEAYESLKAALRIDPYFELTRRNMRSLLPQLGSAGEPMREFEQLIERVAPLLQSRSWPELRRVSERLSELLPGAVAIEFLLANVYFELKDWPKAEQAYLMVQKLEPEHFNAAMNLALAYQVQGRVEDARKTYQKLLELYPGDGRITAELAKLPK